MSIDFSGTPLSGPSPLAVTFKDLSSPSLLAWNWDFGDGNGSNLQNPTHTYAVVGQYSVSLAGTGPGYGNYYTFAIVPAQPNYVIAPGASPFNPAGFNVHIGQWNNNYIGKTVFVYHVDSAGNVTKIGSYSAGSNQPSAYSSQVDVDGLMNETGSSPATYQWNEGLAGTKYTFVCTGTASLGGAGARFAIRGPNVVIGSSSTGSNKLWSFDKTTGTLKVVSAPLPEPVSSILIDLTGAYCYALGRGDTQMYKLDLATMTLQQTIPVPQIAIAMTNCIIVMDDDGSIYFKQDAQGPSYATGIFRFNFSNNTWTEVFTNLTEGEPVSTSMFGMSGGLIYAMDWTTTTSPTNCMQVISVYQPGAKTAKANYVTVVRVIPAPALGQAIQNPLPTLQVTRVVSTTPTYS